MGHYVQHILICCNRLTSLHRGCGYGGAEDALPELKARLMTLARTQRKAPIRVNKTDCLGRCSAGPVLVVYPEQSWYHYQNIHELESILEERMNGIGFNEHLKID